MNRIAMMGLNFRTAPIETRECFALSSSSIPSHLADLYAKPSVSEVVLVSTCNRTEIYLTGDSEQQLEEAAKQFLARASGMQVSKVAPFIYTHRGIHAVKHLFRVSCGLDSMVVGETQILGQVRDAHEIAVEVGATGPMLNQVFRRAITVAKRAHTETKIGEHAVSVSYAAVELAKKIFTDLTNKTILIIGAGKMSELTAKHLTATGVSQVLVINRTYERAKELADKFQGQAFEMGSLSIAIKEADIVISSTGAEGYVLTESMLKPLMKERRKRPLFLIDIAVPRDLDPRMNHLDDVYLYDIDDLEGVIAVNRKEREHEALQVQTLIENAMDEFLQWQQTQAVVPLIRAVQEKGNAIQQSVMTSIQNKLPNLSEHDLKVLQKHTASIVSQLLREPIGKLKEISNLPDAAPYLTAFSVLFGLNQEPSSSQNQHTGSGGRQNEPK